MVEYSTCGSGTSSVIRDKIFLLRFSILPMPAELNSLLTHLESLNRRPKQRKNNPPIKLLANWVLLRH